MPHLFFQYLIIVTKTIDYQSYNSHKLSNMIVIINTPRSLAFHTWVSLSPCHVVHDNNLMKDEGEAIEGPKLTLILLPAKKIFIPHKTMAQMKNA
jgi:uncharacterized UBP type Zn finger protein